MKTLLSVYAQLMCRAIWTVRRVVPAVDGPLPDVAVAKRDWEWRSNHVCQSCRHEGRHRFIAWTDEDVTTAECPACGFEEKL